MDRTRAALVVNEVTSDMAGNLSALVDSAYESAERGARLALFPEAALTGLAISGVPERDLANAQPIPGPVTDAFAALAREKQMWVALGLLERDGDELYDSAVIAAPDGRIVLKYRRMSSGWQGRRADRAVYKQGLDLPCAATALGSTAVVISSDLFEEDVGRRLEQARPECVLVPFGLQLDDGSAGQEHWDEAEAACSARVASLGAPTLLTNYVAGRGPSGNRGSIGGATAFGSDGTVLARRPTGEPGVLVVDLPAVKQRDHAAAARRS